MKRKILSLSLAVLLLVSLFSLCVSATYDESLPLEDFTIFKGNQSTLHNVNEEYFRVNDVMKNFNYTTNAYIPNDASLNGELSPQLNSIQFIGDLPDNAHKLSFSVKIVDQVDMDISVNRYGIFVYNGEKSFEMRLKNQGDGSGSFNGELSIGNGKTVKPIRSPITSLPEDLSSLPPYEYIWFYGYVDLTSNRTYLTIEFASYLFERIYQFEYEYETQFYNSTANPSIRINCYETWQRFSYSCMYFDEIDISYSTIDSGVQSAINNAYVEAFGKGYNYGYSEQKKIIKEEVYSEAYNKGTTDGYSKGYDVGYDEGYDYCLESDESQIYKKGFDDGADAIRKDNANASAVTRFFDGMLESTQGVMNTFFSLDIGGVTLGWIIGILASAVAIFIALKIFIRG